MSHRIDHLIDFPREMLEEIWARGDFDWIRFTELSKSYYSSHTDKRKIELNILKSLLSFSALSVWAEAEKIWKERPYLLTHRGTIYHPNCLYYETKKPEEIPFYKNPGRYKYVNRSAWQIAVMNEEYEAAEKMAAFMKSDEIIKQFDEIFPDGRMVKYHFDLDEGKRLLQILFNAVVAEKDMSAVSESTELLQMRLYTYAKPAPEHDSGLVFDADFCEAAKKLYEERHDEFGDDARKHEFWCIRVEEWLAGCLGTGHLSSHVQGIGNPTVPNKGCVTESNTLYFPFRRSADDFLPGFNVSMGYYGFFQRGYTDPSSRDFLSKPARARLLQQKKESRDKFFENICELKRQRESTSELRSSR